MVKTLILSHGGVAHELLSAAERIAGRKVHLFALALDWDESPERARQRLARSIEEIGVEDGLLILIDMFGGTPYNVAASFRRPGEVEIVTGVNLPMVLRLACLEEGARPLAELAEWIVGKARRSIRVGDRPREESGNGAPVGGAAAKTRSDDGA